MKETLLNLLTYAALVAMAVAIAFVLADAIFGGEQVTYWLADLVA